MSQKPLVNNTAVNSGAIWDFGSNTWHNRKVRIGHLAATFSYI